MKNTIKIFTVIVATAVLLTYNAVAQSAVGCSTANNASMPSPSVISNVGGLPGNDNSISDIHPRAINDFQKSFKDISNEKWSKSNEGYFASFNLDSVQTRVDYNRKGRWLETIRYYSEKKLPDDVKNFVKNVYRHYDIIGGAEISSYKTLVYVVHIRDEAHIKVISIYDGEMQEIQNYTRG